MDKKKYIEIDVQKLSTIIREKGFTQNGLSEAIGREKSYIHSVIKSGHLPLPTYKLLLRTLEIEPEDLAIVVETPSKSPEIAVKSSDMSAGPAPQIDFNMIATVVTAAMKNTNDMLISLSKDIMDLRRDISALKRTTEDGIVWQETMAESLEKVSQGINTVKLQNARIKDAVGIGEAQPQPQKGDK